ncbi:MAG: hypothetical protein WDA09_06700 [Bacteriovoracaceae bacterium]
MTIFTFGQDAINYQGVCRTPDSLVASTPISISINILDSSGTTVYSETHLDTTNEFGLFAIEIGHGDVDPTHGTFKDIDFAAPIFMELWVDISGDSIYVGTSQFLSVPNALYAKEAGSVRTTVLEDSTDYTMKQDSVYTNRYTLTLNQSIVNEILVISDIVFVFEYDANGFVAKTPVPVEIGTTDQYTITLDPTTEKMVIYIQTTSGIMTIEYTL